MTQCIAESRKPSVQVAWDTFAAQSLAVSSATTPLLTSWFEWAPRLARGEFKLTYIWLHSSATNCAREMCRHWHGQDHICFITRKFFCVGTCQRQTMHDTTTNPGKCSGADTFACKQVCPAFKVWGVPRDVGESYPATTHAKLSSSLYGEQIVCS